jgi:hypothetical protein
MTSAYFSQDVDVGMLPDYPRRVCGDGGKPGCIDDTANIYDDKIYLSRGECRTYIGGAEVNALAMYGMMTTDPQSQLLYVDKCDGGSHSGQEDDINCMTHVVPTPNPPAKVATGQVVFFDTTPFITDVNVGFEASAFVYVPDICANATRECDLLVRFHGCGGNPGVQVDGTMHQYADTNGIVVLYPRIRKNNNASRTYQNSFEISRGCWDGYGQLSPDYALQNGQHMSIVWNMVKHISGRF